MTLETAMMALAEEASCASSFIPDGGRSRSSEKHFAAGKITTSRRALK